MATRVLVVEDQADIASPLVRSLEREGYDVDWVQRGADALAKLPGEFAIMLLDLGLPDADGLEVCRQAREGGFAGGIMILTARATEMDRVVGLDDGADDYIAKPFSLAELHARMRALLRRNAAAPVTPAGGTVAAPAAPATSVTIDAAAHRVHVDGTEISLTQKEYAVLELLLRAPGSVVSRDELMGTVWDENWFGSTKVLDVTVGRLRGKLDDAGCRDQVVTVRGVGFRLEPAA